MQRSIVNQVSEALTAAHRPLLAVPSDATPDAFASMLALSLVLEQQKKETYLLSASHVPKELQFLPGSSQVHEMIEPTREIIIDIPLGDVKSDHVAWEQHDGGVRLLITPERGKTIGGNITPSVSIGRYPWDIIVTLGTPNLERLGKPFSGHAPFFYETPVVNIDRGTANEFFGATNLVQVAAGTVSEVVYDLISSLEHANTLLTSDVATSLYTGLVAGTRSFRDTTTTPRTLMIASRLLELNADQQTVTQQLMHARSLATLRLIGHGLAALKNINGRILWAALLENHFQSSGATPDTVSEVLEEILERAGNRNPILAVFEQKPSDFEALIFPGRMSDDDRKTIAEAVSGNCVGKFIRVSLKHISKENIEQALRERIVPHLPAGQ